MTISEREARQVDMRTRAGERASSSSWALAAAEQLGPLGGPVRGERLRLKSWKLTEEDWLNREKRPEYTQATEDMIARTDQPQSGWHLIEGDSKRYARRVKVIETVIAEIERGMRACGMEPPPRSRK
jgi:Polyphosphate kinase 2 (PPK2)